MKRVVILVGHGAPAADCPRELVTRLKALEGRRAAGGGSAPSPEERELEAKVRAWPRTPENDPYRAGLERLAAELAPMLGGAELLVAYNEFCAPTLAEAVATAVQRGATEVEVVPSMLTPGGVHAEVEIPEALARLRAEHPSVTLRYAWPFDLTAVARLFAAQLARDVG
ncbi:CbiX/SirB N-terminal domain-containing protein [Sorangium sp. So ce296]|uniref:sirohydrochlorin chelatase n=1 Tax=Sorangium sp. So ce296 TaxID=3133296 RepID=UPI003F5FCD4A